jgi:hypothetical protein
MKTRYHFKDGTPSFPKFDRIAYLHRERHQIVVVESARPLQLNKPVQRQSCGADQSRSERQVDRQERRRYDGPPTS